MRQRPVIDLRSDTVTRPTLAMRRAMAEAEVGDDVLDGDPTVKRLEARVAELLGKEAALFFPTGTMANQAAIWLLSRPGTEVFVDVASHILNYELAGAAALAGVQLRSIVPAGAVMDVDDLTAALRLISPHEPRPSLLCLENTNNGAGGKVTSAAAQHALRSAADAASLPVHLDGARLWNAAAATGSSLADLAACGETVMVSFSKGLGAPAGAALAGSRALIADAWFARRRFGGAMRQSGILAAGALHGLDVHLARLADDHERAREYARIVDGAGGAQVVPPDTNIVMLDLTPSVSATTVAERAAAEGVLVAEWSPTRVRAVTHLDVDEEMVRHAAEIVRTVLDDA